MSIQVKDFRKLEGKEKDDSIFLSLQDIAKALATIPPDATLVKQILLPFQVTKEMQIPPGYEKCNGQNGTKDLQKYFTPDFIYIQRVK